MPRAVVMRAPGGPEALELRSIDVGAPGPGQVRLRQTAVGVNFHDIYVRSGLSRLLKAANQVCERKGTKPQLVMLRRRSAA